MLIYFWTTQKVELNLNQLFDWTPDVSKKSTISLVHMSQCEKQHYSICHLRRAESEQWPPSDGKAVHSCLFLFGADLFECPASIWLFTNLNGPCLTVELFWSLLNTNPYFFLYLCTSVLTSVDLSSVNQEFSSLILIKSDTRTGGFSGLILVLHPSIHVWYLHYSPKTDEQGEYVLPVWHEKKKGSSYHRAWSTKLWEKISKFISLPVFFLWVG